MPLVSFGLRLVPSQLLARIQRQQADSRAGDEERLREERLAERAAQERRRALAARGLGPNGQPLPAGILRRLLLDEPGAVLPSYPVAQIIAARAPEGVRLRCVTGTATATFIVPGDTLTITGAPPVNLEDELPGLDWQTRTNTELGLIGDGTFLGLVGGSDDLAEAQSFTGIDFEDPPITPEVGPPFWEGVANPTTQVTTEVAHVCLFCVLPVKRQTAIFVGSTYAQTTTETAELQYRWTATVYDSTVDPGGFVVFGRTVENISTETANTAPLVGHNCYVFNDSALRAIPTPAGLNMSLNTYYDSADYVSLETSLPSSYGITYKTDNEAGLPNV